MAKTRRHLIMSKLLFLVIFQLLCVPEAFANKECDYSQRVQFYLDIAGDWIGKARSLVPEDVTMSGSEGKTPGPPLDCKETLSSTHKQSIIETTLLQEKSWHPMDCEELLRNGHNVSGVYNIWPRSRLTDGKSLRVYCDMDTDGGGWTVIQRRGDFGNHMEFFYKDWLDYKHGFGDIQMDFWLGNDYIFAITNQRDYSIRFDLKDIKGESRHALYDHFWINDETHKYLLHIQNYSGDAGDSIIEIHANQKFSTKDQDNDSSQGTFCSRLYKGGWWYGSCTHSNLNGLYTRGVRLTDGSAITWKTFRGYRESLDTTEMKIRPMNFKRNPIPGDIP